jgi:hypothetical protein
MFARLGPEVVIKHPDSGIYRFHGGHRLWAGPEVPAMTYAPDDHPCLVASDSDHVVVTALPDKAGLAKVLEVGLADGRLIVDHRISNAGTNPVSLAPWGITQLRLGGVALIPTTTGRGQDPFQADSSLVIWPYNDLTDPRLSWRKRAAIIEATPGPRLKIGVGPNPGCLGYLIEHQLFIKEIVPAGSGTYPDRGAVGQVFVEDSFCELESVGPIVVLEPGSSVSHRESWEVSECADLATAYDRVVNEVSA